MFQNIFFTTKHHFKTNEQVIAIFRRYINERSSIEVNVGDENRRDPTQLTIALEIDNTIGAEGFRIEVAGNVVHVVGNDELGQLYGVGKLLRSCRFEERGVTVGDCAGTSVPHCPLRGMYLASHMRNFYEAAPPEEVRRYLEDLSLWGYNAILLHCYHGLDEEYNRDVLAKYRSLLQLGREVGMRVGFLIEPNIATAVASIPEEIRNTPYPDDLRKRGDAGIKICPSNPEGHSWLMRHWHSLLSCFADLQIDYLSFFPYDAGGCGCEQCWPWGSRGFLNISRDYREVARRIWPNCEYILATWMFDMPHAGEWEGLTAALEGDDDWISYVMCDDDEDFPAYPLQSGVLGGAKLLNFAEITMWGMWPWGGYGANPLPQRLQRLWGQVKDHVAGGFPYSEGIYDDINKFIVSQLYWSPNRPVDEIVREYIASEFSPEVVPSVSAAIEALERTQTSGWTGDPEYPDALDLLQEADAKLPERIRASWRWRILMRRAELDRERLKSPVRTLGNHWPTAACAPALRELIDIYHAWQADGPVLPPLDRANSDTLAIPAPATAVRD